MRQIHCITMGVGKSKEPPLIEILATGTVGTEALRRLLDCAGMGRVTVTDPSTGCTASQSNGSEFGAGIGSSMMVLPDDDAKLYLLSLKRTVHPRLLVDGYSLLAPCPDATTLANMLERKAMVFVVDAAHGITPAAAFPREKEQLHELLGRMSGRPPLVVVLALNSKQGCHPLPGKDGGSLSDDVRLRLGLDELAIGGAVVHLLEMSSEDFPDTGVVLEALEWVANELRQQL